MEQEFQHESPLVKRVGIFINPTPTKGTYKGTVSVDLGNGQHDPFSAISFVASAYELRSLALSILEEIAPPSYLITKKVVDSRNKEGVIVGINKTTGQIRVYWTAVKLSSWVGLEDLVVLD